MAQTSARRAEKQRRRNRRRQQDRGPTPPRGAEHEFGFGFVDDEPFELDPRAVAAEAFDSAARKVVSGLPHALALAGLVPLWEGNWEATAAAADLVLQSLVAELATGNWRPTDLAETARRRLDSVARTVLRDAVLAAGTRGGPLAADREWAAEAATLGASVAERSAVAHRTSAEGWRRDVVCGAVVAILVDTFQWPILQPFGESGEARAEDTAETAMLAKVRALLAKAESTMFEHEAEAYTAKAQELMARYAIDRAMLTPPAATTRTSTVRIWIDAPYVTAKSLLIDAVAGANRCRCVLFGAWGFATVVGESSDVRAVVLLVTSLQVQAVRAMARLGSPARGLGAPSTQSFRQSFLVAFAARIGERLAEADAAVQQQVADPSRLLPVLAARSRAVDDRFEELFPHTISRPVVTSSSAGLQAGRAAADLAQLAYGESLEATG